MPGTRRRQDLGVRGCLSERPARGAQGVRRARQVPLHGAHGLDDDASSRLLVHAAKLIELGMAPLTACSVYIAEALTDDADMPSVVNELRQRSAEVAAEPAAFRERR